MSEEPEDGAEAEEDVLVERMTLRMNLFLWERKAMEEVTGA